MLEELHTKYKLGNSSNADGKTPKKMGNGDCLLATPPPTPDVSVDAKNIQAAGDCLKYKELGNDATRAKDYRLAIEHYTKSIQCDPTHLASYSNRCQAHLKLNMFQDAIEDASVVIDKLQNNSEDRVMLVKVFYRRALAYKGLYEGAMSDMTGSARLQSNTQYNYYLKSGMSDIEQLLKLDPNNKAAKTERAILEKYSIDSAPANVTPTKVESSSNPSGLAERSTKLRTPTGQNAESKSESGSLFSPPVVTTPDKTPPPPKKKASKTKATPTREPISKEVVVPTEAPLTVFEFERVWRVLRSKPDLFIVAYVGKVFKKSTYKKVLKSSLSDELLSYLLKHTYEQCIVLRNGSNDKDSITIAFGILKGLTYAEGLDMLLSLLSADDMKYIQLILDEIDSFCNEHQISPQDINPQKLKLVYRV